jgi:hypothetical protein
MRYKTIAYRNESKKMNAMRPYKIMMGGFRGGGESPNCKIIVEPRSRVENIIRKSISHFNLGLISPSGNCGVRSITPYLNFEHV